MRTILRVLSASILAFGIGTSAFADTFVSPSSKPTQRYAPITPLTPFDEALRREMQKYPKDSAFYVDGRTGKIISVNKLPKVKSTPAQKPSTYKPAPRQRKMPYEMHHSVKFVDTIQENLYCLLHVMLAIFKRFRYFFRCQRSINVEWNGRFPNVVSHEPF